MWILIYLTCARVLLSLQYHASDHCTINIHSQPSPPAKIVIPRFKKVCGIELSASVLLGWMYLIDIDMALDKIALEVLACLYTDEGPE